MKLLEKINFKKIILSTIWILLGAGTVALLVSGLYVKEAKRCTGLYIEILGVSNNFFIDKHDVLEIIQHSAGNKIKGKPINEFRLDVIERELKKDVWVSKAELYFDKNGLLKADIIEKDPVARIFAIDGNSFYIDQTLNILPLSSRHSARLPVFTNFPTSFKVMSKADSTLLKGIKQMSLYIQKDSFLMAMIDQVNIVEQNHFELIPKMGEQLILFGDDKNMEDKFEKFTLFYKKIIPIYGWKKYNKIRLDFSGQIVASIKGIEDVKADSLRTMAMMKAMADYSLRMAGDTTQTLVQDNAINTTDMTMILQSFSRDEVEDNATVIPQKIEMKVQEAPKAVKPNEIIAKPGIKSKEGINKVQKSKEKTTNKKPAKIIKTSKHKSVRKKK